MNGRMRVVCGLAADTLVETPEGPMEIRKVAGKEIPVCTRASEGRVRFRLMRNVRAIAAAAPVVQVRLDNGLSFRAVPSQEVYLANLERIALVDLRPGVALYPAFHYPRGYRYRTDAGREEESLAAWRVEAVEPSGEAEVFALRVVPEHCFFVTAGVLCASE